MTRKSRTVDVLQEPSFTHPFGTDASGLDIFSVVIAAFRTDLSIALLGVGASFVLGLLLGSISGFSAAGGRIWRVSPGSSMLPSMFSSRFQSPSLRWH